MNYSIFKRFIDIFFSSIVFLLLLPIFLIVLILLYFANNGKPFFFQERPGKNENIFKVVKFKTMSDKCDKNGKLLPDKDRITWIGKIIRSTSLDEIPQLLNVLKGDMSLVGPRPLLCSYLPLYNEFQRQRHKVKPGITGWAQINGRNAISWEKRFEYDIWYVNNYSFIYDLRIIFLTIKKVFIREGINSNGDTTMKPFTGHE